MDRRNDVLCGQINLHKGIAGATNLREHISNLMHTNPQQLNVLGQRESDSSHYQCSRISAFIICLQEPPTNGGKVVGFGRGNNVFYGKHERPRAAIYSSRNLNLWPVAEFTTRDVTTCLWKWPNGKEVYVTSVYMDILNRQVADQTVINLLDFCKRNSKELLLCSDTNAHSSLWNCNDTNGRGSRLEELIFQYKLKVHNEGQHFTFFRGTAKTIVDVTLSMGDNMAELVSNWRVSEEVQGSDHLLLQWTITISSPNHVKFRDMKKGDWSLFQDVLEAKSNVLRTHREWTPRLLDERSMALESDIKYALDKSHPERWRKPTVKNTPEFTPELIRWQKKVKACFSNYRKRGSEFAFEQLKQARRTFKNILKKVRRESWQTFTEEAVDPKKAALLNKVIQGRNNHTIGIMKRDDGTWCQSPQESILRVVDTHFPGNEDIGTFRYTDTTITELNTNSTAFITQEKVVEAAKTFGDYKAAGPDGLQPCVLKHIGANTLTRICDIYKASYLLGHVPSNWCKSKVIFIPKTGKDDYTKPRSFRPISLSPFMLKIMERIVLWHLNDTCLINNPLSEDQHAFRSGKSTETALTTFVSKVERALHKNQLALGVFLDIQGAFDNVKPSAIVRGMEAKGIDDKTIAWYYYYLTNRKMSVMHNGTFIERKLTLGTPQGGVLSPTMWNLAFEGFLDLFQRGPVKVSGFADDGALLAVGKDERLLASHAQLAVNKALEWGQEQGLMFSPAKTVAVLFNRKRHLQMPPEIMMEGTGIEYQDEVKYLGVTLDSGLKWKAHIRKKLSNAKKQLLAVRNASGKLWGTQPKISRWIYTSIIRPSFTYGSLLWARACTSQWAIKELERLNRMALLYFSSFRRSTPTAGLEVMFHVSPLHIHVIKEACLGLNRTAPKGEDGVIQRKFDVSFEGHRSFCWKNLDSLDLGVTETDRTKTYSWNKQYSVASESFLDGKPPKRTRYNATDIEIYTDGSGINDSFGAGFVAYRKAAHPSHRIVSESYHLGETSSVYQGEMYAIKKAAQWIYTSCTDRRVVICSDSMAALQALNRARTISSITLETKVLLNRAAYSNQITLRWIRSHQGHLGNEEADKAAKAGALQQQFRVTDPPLIPEANVKLKYKSAFFKKWQEYWTNRPDCRQTKLWLPNLSKRHSFDLLQSSRKKLSIMVQLITGHNFLKRHESLVNKDDSNECRLCLEDEETSFHIVAECPALAEPRLLTFGTCFQKPPLQWTTKETASFIKKASIGSLLDPTEILGSGLSE